MLKYIKNKKLRKLLKRLFITAIIILVLIVILVIVANALKSSYRKLYKVGETQVLSESYSNTFNEININTKMTDIYIKQSNDNNVNIIAYGEEDYIELNKKNNKLFIDIKDKNLIALNLYSYISKIEVYLPANYNEVIHINSEFGNIEIDEFINSTLDVNQKIGNLSVDGVHFVKTKNKEGNINIESANIIRIDAKNGNIKLGTIKDLEVTHKYGDLTIDNIDEYLKLDVESGNIEINNITLTKDSYIEAKYGDIKINNVKDVYVDAKTDHGKVNIKNNDKKSDFVLKIRNDNGDIKVN